MQKKRSNDFEDLKAKIKAIDIIDIASKLNLPLDKYKKIGNNLAGACPSGHPSNSGMSFHLTPGSNLFHCWNCGEGGDNIELVKFVKKTNFIDSLRWIMKEFNFSENLNNYIIDIRTPEQIAKAKIRTVNTLLYEELIIWGKDLLLNSQNKEAADARQYLLADRKYDLDTLKKTEFFFIPSYQEAVDHLNKKFPNSTNDIKNLPIKGGFGDQLKINLPYRLFDKTISGLVKRYQSPNGLPYKNNAGKTVFARWDATPSLHKEDMFGSFGIDKNEKTVILVEGYPDSEYLRALGLPVLALGSALPTAAQIRNLNKLKQLKSIILALDSDSTGLKNTEKLIQQFGEQTNLTIEVLTEDALGGTKDLDEFYRAKGITEVKKVLATKTILGVFWYINYLKDRNFGVIPSSRIDELYKIVAFMPTEALGLFQNNLRKYTDIPWSAFKQASYKHKEDRERSLYTQDVQANPLKSWPAIPFINTKGYWYFDRYKDIPDPSTLDSNALRSYTEFERISKIPNKALLKELAESTIGRKIETLPLLEITYDPHHIYEIDIEKQLINTFIPTKWMHMKKNKEVLSPPIHFPVIYEFLSQVLGQDDNIDVDWIINWISAAFHKRDKLRTSLVIVGTQGAGKNVFVDLIIKNLFGIPNVAVVSDSEMNSKYNGYMGEKLFIVFNELSQLKDAKKDAQVKIKGWVTDNITIVEKKFQDSLAIRSFFNVLFVSNYGAPIVIEPDDRRFNCIRVPQRKLFQTPLFKSRGWDESNFEDFRQKVAEEFPNFVQYMLNTGYDDIKANTAVMNGTKAFIIEENTNIYAKFAEALKTKNMDELDFMQLNGSSTSEANPYTWIKEHAEEGIILVNQALIMINNSRTFQSNISATTLAKRFQEYGIKRKRLRIPVGGVQRPTYFIIPSSPHYDK